MRFLMIFKYSLHLDRDASNTFQATMKKGDKYNPMLVKNDKNGAS